MSYYQLTNHIIIEIAAMTKEGCTAHPGPKL